MKRSAPSAASAALALLAVSASAAFPAHALQLVYEPAAVSEPVLSRPHDLILAPDGRHLQVADLGHHVVRVMNADTLAVVGEIGAGDLSAPHDIDVDPAGRIIVADPGNNRLQVLSPDLEFEFSIGGAPPHAFNEPKYFALDQAGRLYVGDQHNHRVLVFDRELTLIGQMGTGSAGDAPNELNGLEGVAVREKDVWIADTYNNRVVRHRRKNGS